MSLIMARTRNNEGVPMRRDEDAPSQQMTCFYFNRDAVKNGNVGRWAEKNGIDFDDRRVHRQPIEGSGMVVSVSTADGFVASFSAPQRTEFEGKVGGIGSEVGSESEEEGPTDDLGAVAAWAREDSPEIVLPCPSAKPNSPTPDEKRDQTLMPPPPKRHASGPPPSRDAGSGFVTDGQSASEISSDETESLLSNSHLCSNAASCESVNEIKGPGSSGLGRMSRVQDLEMVNRHNKIVPYNAEELVGMREQRLASVARGKLPSLPATGGVTQAERKASRPSPPKAFRGHVDIAQKAREIANEANKAKSSNSANASLLNVHQQKPQTTAAPPKEYTPQYKYAKYTMPPSWKETFLPEKPLVGVKEIPDTRSPDFNTHGPDYSSTLPIVGRRIGVAWMYYPEPWEVKDPEIIWCTGYVSSVVACSWQKQKKWEYGRNGTKKLNSMQVQVYFDGVLFKEAPSSAKFILKPGNWYTKDRTPLMKDEDDYALARREYKWRFLVGSPNDDDEEDSSPAQQKKLKVKGDKVKPEPKRTFGRLKADSEMRAGNTRKAILAAVETARAVAAAAYDVAAPSGKTLEVKGQTTNVWTCDAATKRHTACIIAKCDDCMKSMLDAGTSRTARRAAAGTKRNRDGIGMIPNKTGCNHSDPESYEKADNQYIVGNYADRARAEGAKLPTHCVDCGVEFVKAGN